MSRIPSAAATTETTSAATTTAPQATNDLRDVDLDEFLQLLIHELQNQDPLDPMDNTEVLNQISQIREISATNNLSDTLSAVLLGQNMSTASSLIGKQISALSDAAEEVEGVVDRVTVDVDGQDDSVQTLRLHVGPHRISLSNVREVVGENVDDGVNEDPESVVSEEVPEQSE